MRRMRRVLAIAATAGLVLAGCGSDGGDALSKEEFESEVAGIGDTLSETFSDISSEAGSLAGETPESGDDLNALADQLAEVVGRGADQLGEAADELEALTPPEEAQAATDQLVEGLRALAADVAELQTALEEGNFASVLDLASNLQDIGSSEGITLIDQAVAELREQGYDIQGATG